MQAKSRRKITPIGNTRQQKELVKPLAAERKSQKTSSSSGPNNAMGDLSRSLVRNHSEQ
uniref:Uncharacterized protein n=1 Tax=Arundo donax TaxID=35708 RepID=A0A0A8XYH3_ARUDO